MLVDIKGGKKKIRKKHEKTTAAVFIDDTLGY